MMEKKPISINLLKKKRVNLVEKFFQWSLTVGRLLIILTEITALSAFVYRFSLDRTLIDLHDEIKKKQVIVGLYKSSESKYRNLQDRLTIAAQFQAKGEKNTKLITDIINLAPRKRAFVFSIISVSENQVKVEASAQSETALKTFIEGLKKHQNIENVSLNKIENKTSSGKIIVSISATIKGDKL